MKMALTNILVKLDFRLHSVVVLLCLTLLVHPLFGKRGFTCKDGVHKSICLPENYSKFELPFTEKTNQIGISIDIDDVLRINDGTYSITFSTYFNVEWMERRLREAFKNILN